MKKYINFINENYVDNLKTLLIGNDDAKKLIGLDDYLIAYTYNKNNDNIELECTLDFLSDYFSLSYEDINYYLSLTPYGYTDFYIDVSDVYNKLDNENIKIIQEIYDYYEIDKIDIDLDLLRIDNPVDNFYSDLIHEISYYYSMAILDLVKIKSDRISFDFENVDENSVHLSLYLSDIKTNIKDLILKDSDIIKTFNISDMENETSLTKSITEELNDEMRDDILKIKTYLFKHKEELVNNIPFKKILYYDSLGGIFSKKISKYEYQENLMNNAELDIDIVSKLDVYTFLNDNNIINQKIKEKYKHLVIVAEFNI